MQAITLRSVLERYAVLQGLTDRTVTLYTHTLDRFRDCLGHEPTIDDLDDYVVAKFLKWRATTPHRGRICSPASVAKDKAQLVSMANFAAKKRMRRSDGEIVEFLSLPRVRTIRHAPQAYTIDEVRRLILEARKREGQVGGHPAGGWWSTIIHAPWETAERIGALMALRWDDVDLDGRAVLFRAETRKGRSNDLLRPITPALADALRPEVRQPDELVWPWDRKQLTSLWTSLKLICKRAGCRGTGFHGLRKSSASYLAAAGGDATEHLGHAKPEVTRQHYLDRRITQTRTAVDFLPPLGLDDEPEQAGSDEGKDENLDATTRRPA